MMRERTPRPGIGAAERHRTLLEINNAPISSLDRVVLCQGPVLELDQGLLPASGSAAPVAATPGSGASPLGLATVEEMERAHIIAALERSGGLIEGPKGAARVLAIHPNTLRSRMAKLGIKRVPHGAASH